MSRIGSPAADLTPQPASGPAWSRLAAWGALGDESAALNVPHGMLGMPGVIT